ncbi:hypothetical protein MAR_033915 [Mya arenaria]|uniref:Uncharacterized protein n=1 Tax=Mya arenaria TaxID=6604 RepID=A0ABY7GDM9_MYAAR|nr:uncharacterized protein LOC128224750 [Mya arenaria]WAR31373.1 hypothetical protein MAR_033915 [Mya arenaria]
MKVTVGFAVAACCVLGYFCGQSEAFECYVCSSLLSSDCADPFLSGSKADNCAMCGKNKAKAGDNEVVTRTCLPIALGLSPGCTSNNAGGTSTDDCYCNSALCNASTRASMTTALLFLMPAFLSCLKNL